MINNTVFGKVMENIRNQKNMKLVATEIKINKPVCLGQVILELSKTLIYGFHYNYIRPKYGSKVS